MLKFKISTSKKIDITLNNRKDFIPFSWNQYKFSETCSISRGGSPRPIQDFLTLDKENSIPWIKISDATAQKKIITYTEQFIIKEGVKRSRKVVPGDLIVSNSASPGIPRFLNIEACIHDGWLLLKDFTLLNKEFTYFLILFIKEHLKSKGAGSIFINLSIDVLGNFEIKCPSILEQKSIASILSKQESIINNLEKVIDNKEKILKEFSHRLLSGEIRLKDENGTVSMYKNADDNWKIDKVNGKDVRFPKDWDNFKLKGNIDIKTGKKDANVAKKDGKYAFFTCGKQILKTDTFDFDCEAILIAGNGDVGETKYYQGKFDAYQRTYVLSNFKYDLKFLFIYMNKFFKDSIDALGSAMPYIKLGYLENFSVNQPKNLNERQLLLKVITSLNDEKQKYEQLLEIEKKKFDFLLDNLLSGKYLVENTEEEDK